MWKLESGPGRIGGGGRPNGPTPSPWLQAWLKYPPSEIKCKKPR